MPAMVSDSKVTSSLPSSYFPPPPMAPAYCLCPHLIQPRCVIKNPAVLCENPGWTWDKVDGNTTCPSACLHRQFPALKSAEQIKRFGQNTTSKNDPSWYRDANALCSQLCGAELIETRPYINTTSPNTPHALISPSHF